MRIRQGCYLGYRKMTPSSPGTWIARARVELTGKQAYRQLGEFDLAEHLRFDAAKTAAEAWFAHLGKGGATAPATIADACTRYVKHLRERRGERAAKDAEKRFDRWVNSNDAFCSLALEKLKPEHLGSWRADLMSGQGKSKGEESQPRTKSTVNRDMTALRAALNLALEDGLVTTDNAWRTKLKPFKNADGRRELYLSHTERVKFVAHAAPDAADFLRGLCMLPLRPGALASLDVGNFDAKLRTLSIKLDKTGKVRKLPLPERTAALFTRLAKDKNPADPLFARSDGQRWNKDSWKHPVKDAVAAAELPAESTAYSLRHSVITDLIHSGLDTLTVAQLSGTSVVMIERHYGHLTQSHGIEAPNIVHTNTLGENINDIQQKDRYDVILANPPFGGKERSEVQQNFPIRTGETAFLFLQHFIRSLNAGGRAAIVIKNSFLNATDNASKNLRKLLLETCDLHTILHCPAGTFQGAGIKTAVLFFTKGASTRSIWSYQLSPGRSLGKTNPLGDADFDEFGEFVARKPESDRSWLTDVAGIDPSTVVLPTAHPQTRLLSVSESSNALLECLRELHDEAAKLVDRLPAIRKQPAAHPRRRIGDLFVLKNGRAFKKEEWSTAGLPIIRIQNLNNPEAAFNYYSGPYAEDIVINPGDLLFSWSGTVGSSFGPHLWKREQGLLNQHIFKVTPRSEMILKYAYYALLRITEQIEAATNGAVGLVHITKEKLNEFKIPIPPLSEQETIVTQLDLLHEGTQQMTAVRQQELGLLAKLERTYLEECFGDEQ